MFIKTNLLVCYYWTLHFFSNIFCGKLSIFFLTLWVCDFKSIQYVVLCLHYKIKHKGFHWILVHLLFYLNIFIYYFFPNISHHVWCHVTCLFQISADLLITTLQLHWPNAFKPIRVILLKWPQPNCLLFTSFRYVNTSYKPLEGALYWSIPVEYCSSLSMLILCTCTLSKKKHFFPDFW